MIAVLVLNLLAVAVAILMPNDVLKHHSYVFFGVQALTIVPYLVRRAFFAKHLFIPTLFVVCYYLANDVVGSYVVPRYYGWNKEYAPVALAIENYGVIVPYLMLANTLLFLLTTTTISSLARTASPRQVAAPDEFWQGGLLAAIGELACFASFVAVTFLGSFAAFSLQLAILLVHLTEVSRRSAPYRLIVYSAYLVAMLAASYDSKRQIIIVLFLILFLEAHRGGYRVRLTPRTILVSTMCAVGFIGIVLTASVLRGYGGFEVQSLLSAAAAVPRYITSDVFMDGLVDNLELNYNYGSAITSIDLALRGTIDYQYGASIWKVLFLPIPRELFPDKPESILQLFTRTFSPGMWAQGGSLPVVLPSDMYLNFGYFGLVPFVLIWTAVNRLFVAFYRTVERSFISYGSAFLFITVLILARGSGLELYLLTFLLGLPVLLVAATVAALANGLVRKPSEAA